MQGISQGFWDALSEGSDSVRFKSSLSKCFLEIDDWDLATWSWMSGFAKIVSVVWVDKSLLGMWSWLSTRRQVRAVSLYNYLRHRCYKKEQKNRVLGDLACLHANGNSAVERGNLMLERRGINFWREVLYWVRADRTQQVEGLALSRSQGS